jgi:hypothetical protein
MEEPVNILMQSNGRLPIWIKPMQFPFIYLPVTLGSLSQAIIGWGVHREIH